MSSFKDNTGREWTIDINVDSIDRVHKATGVSIHLLLDDKCKAFGELVANMPAFAHVCYILCDAEEAGVDQRVFAKGLKGDPFNLMVDAFLEELTLFFPDPRRREAVGKIIQSLRSLNNQMMTKLTTEMETFDPEKVATDVLTKMLKKKSGN